MARRLSTVVGFYRYAEEEGVIDHSPAVHVRRPRIDYQSHVAHLDRTELGAILVAAGLSSPSDHALVSLLALNGLRVSEAIGADIAALGLERGHPPLTVLRKGGKIATLPASRHGWPERLTWPSVTGATARSSSTLTGCGWTGTPQVGLCDVSPGVPAFVFGGHQEQVARHDLVGLTESATLWPIAMAAPPALAGHRALPIVKRPAPRYEVHRMHVAAKHRTNHPAT